MGRSGAVGARIAKDLALLAVDLPPLDAYCRRAAELCTDALQAAGAVLVLAAPEGLTLQYSSLPDEVTEVIFQSPDLRNAIVAGDISRGTLRDRAALLIPLGHGGGEPVGALYLLQPGCSLEPDDVLAFEIAAIHIGGYITRSRAESELSQLREQALRDALTDLPNRRAFDERLRSEWTRARRGQYALSLIIVDVDHFGLYNTRYGHPAGDETLRAIARALRGALKREADFVARYGGEEFVVILPATELDGAILVAERLREEVAKRAPAHETTVLGRVTISLGAACARPGAANSEQMLLSSADEWLLSAKSRGRNRLVCDGYESHAQPNDRRYEKRHNLPNEITRFVGRKREVSEICSLAKRSRLTSIVGPGGVGKTRIACEVAAQCADRHAGGARFIDLSSVTRADALLPAIAHALEVRGDAHEPLEQTILKHIAESDLLLILDNCEQIADDVAATVERVLGASANVRILCTTRQRLDLIGETVYELKPLSPGDAKELFAERVHAATAASVQIASDEDLIRTVCERLDCLPLAIELVAPRVPSIGMEGMLTVLDDRSFVLSTSRRGTRRRQQTVSNLLDWSYRLLPPKERLVFRRLAVLVGQWDRDAAVAVCCDDAVSPSDVQATLAELARKSLLSYDAALGRYRMLELTAQFAREKLDESGEYAQCRQRHSAEYARRSARINDDAYAGRFAQAEREFSRSWPNIVSALHQLLEQGADVNTGSQIAADLALIWDASGRAQEAAYWLSLAMAHEDLIDPRTFALVLLGCGIHATTRSDPEALRRYAVRALEYFEHSDDNRALSCALRLRANAEAFVGNYDEALRFDEESLRVAERANDVRSCGLVLINLGVLASEGRGDYEAGVRYYERAVDVLRTIDYPTGVAHALMNLADVRMAQGRINLAIPALEESIGLFKASGHRLRCHAQTLLASCHLRRDEPEHAQPLLKDTLDQYAEFPAGRWSAFCLEQCAWIALAHGDYALGAQLAGCAAAYTEEHGFAVIPYEREGFDALCTRLRTALGEQNYSAAYAEGASWQIQAAISIARTITAEPFPPADVA